MDAKQIEQLILYIVYQVEDLGGYTTTIRLVKFLYLIDLEYYRRYGRALTNLDWRYYFYGPYAFEIPRIGARLGFNLEREEFVSDRGRRGALLHVNEPQDFPSSLAAGAEVVVNGILSVWTDIDTDGLLDYVYHRTEPMKNAQRGQPLDFSIIERGTKYYEVYLSIDEKLARRLRDSLRANAQKSLTEFAHPITVRDAVLQDGLRTLEADQSPMPDFVGIMPEVNVDELQATLSNED